MEISTRRIFLSLCFPLFFLLILYMMQFLEVGTMEDFSRFGIYPMAKKGIFGIFAHPLIHHGIRHLLANTFPLIFLMWALFYFYKDTGAFVFLFVWLLEGLLTFFIGKPGWHVGSSGLIYAMAFFLFFSGILRKQIPLIAISLLVTFLYGGMVWNMFPFFAKETTSWEGHLSGAIAGTAAAFLFRKCGAPASIPEELEGELTSDGIETPADGAGKEAEVEDVGTDSVSHLDVGQEVRHVE